MLVPMPKQLMMMHDGLGHLFRTWRRRWVVIEASMLKYYTNQLATPPYGGSLTYVILLLTCIF